MALNASDRRMEEEEGTSEGRRREEKRGVTSVEGSAGCKWKRR